MTNSLELRAVDIKGLAATDRLLSGLHDLTGLFKEIARVLGSQTHMRFDLKKDPDGEPWAAWAPSTLKVRTKQGYVQPGNLMQLHNPGMRDTVTTSYGSDFAQLVLAADYAPFHEQLEPVSRANLPRRAMVFGADRGLGSDDLAVVNSSILDYFDALSV